MHTFANSHFLKIIEDSGSASPQRGWHPVHLTKNDNTLISYVKDHSYGEYIFDWAWADLYYRMGLEYYPKLIHAIPFTPVNNSKFTKNLDSDLLKESFEFYQNSPFSSEHYYFTDKEYTQLEDLGFFKQVTTQYHFINEYDSFEDYLSKLRKNKRKNIKKERRTCDAYELKIEKVDARDLQIEELKQIYGIYLTTIDKKSAYPYLTLEFFIGLKELDNCFFHLAYLASKEDEIIAMAMFFESETKLYGRYWGIHPLYQSSFDFLHFEMCYYMGMEYTIDKGLRIFEAGAQGEQKLYRGFRPVEIESWHHLKNTQIHEALRQHVLNQNKQVQRYHQKLNELLPFKK
ncbi:peptidogalycan biosysnthesis protein [Halobacteriovorax sp. DPLXC-1]|uniref:peptidogalycan biosysnthesis protein n=1 Tax=Halobacteriovorax sp. DPLXC-1 TaxID=3110771 RepID=UPI002FF21F12